MSLMFGSFVVSNSIWMKGLVTTFVAVKGLLFMFRLFVDFNMVLPVSSKVTLVTVVSYSFVFGCFVALEAFFFCHCEFTQLTGISNTLMF